MAERPTTEQQTQSRKNADLGDVNIAVVNSEATIMHYVSRFECEQTMSPCMAMRIATATPTFAQRLQSIGYTLLSPDTTPNRELFD